MNPPHLLPLPPLAHARVELAYAQAALDEWAAAGGTVAQLGWPHPTPDPLPVAHYLELLARGAARPGGADFGLRVGARMRTSTFVSYGHVLLSCARFGDAVLQTQRFECLAHDLGRSELVVHGPLAEYRWHTPWLSRGADRHLPESVLAGILAFGTWLAQRPLPVVSVELPGPAPDDTVAQRVQARLGVPVRYGAPVTCARFAASLLEEPIPSADPRLFPLLSQHAEQQLLARSPAGGAEAPLLTQLRTDITRHLAQDGARVAAVAARLGLAPRTLQRRLAAAGTSFQAQLDDARRELACHHLRHTAASLTEVAFLLGYAEQSSFNHAFRDWFGCTPAQWRAQARAHGTVPS